MTRSLLALVPARGGSKGLPRKNARRLGDLPLLGWTAEAARASGAGGALWLSTDDEEIAAIGREVGLEVPFLRPAELSTDEAGAVGVALHALDRYAATHGGDPDDLLLLQPTSPFRPPAAIAEARARLEREPALDAVLGVKAIYRTLSTLFHAADDMRLAPVAAVERATRRQEVRALYTPNGALYLIRTTALRRERTFFPERTAGLLLDEIASIDIDHPTDWAIAEAVAAAGITWRGRPDTPERPGR